MVTEYLSPRPFDAKGWRDAHDPRPLLKYLKELPPGPRARPLNVNPGRRKARYFAVGCCRRVEHLFKFPHLSDLLAAVEDYAEGRVGVGVLVRAARAAGEEVGGERAGPTQLKQWRDWVTREAHRQAPEYLPLWATPADKLAHGACLVAAAGDSAAAVDCWEYTAEAVANAGGDLAAELAFQADLLRDLFGDPFHPAAFDPGWRTAAVRDLARSAYESGDFGGMPVLADALQEAGCEGPEVLAHCRAGVPHARGCWVVDAVLGL